MDSPNKAVLARISAAAKRKAGALTTDAHRGMQAARILRAKNTAEKAVYEAYFAAATQKQKSELSAYMATALRRKGSTAARNDLVLTDKYRAFTHLKSWASPETGATATVYGKNSSRKNSPFIKLEAVGRGASTIFDVSGSGTCPHFVSVPPDAASANPNQSFAESISAISKDFLAALRSTQRR